MRDLIYGRNVVEENVEDILCGPDIDDLPKEVHQRE